MTLNPQVPASIVWRKLDDNTILVTPLTGKIRVLNGVGSDVWQMLVEKTPLPEIEAALTAKYAVSTEQAQQDIKTFIADLASRGLLDLA